MSKIIIGIHGLGNKPEAALLEEWWKKSIKEGLRRIGIYFLPFNFKLVYWADLVYDKPLDEKIKDAKSPFRLDEPYIPQPNPDKAESHFLRQKILDMIEWNLDKLFLNNDLSINYENITNKIVKKYFHELDFYYSGVLTDKKGKTHRAKDLIRERLISAIKKHRRNDILLICHSMGSIISYDVMTISMPKQRINTFVTTGSPLGIPVVMGKNAIERNLKGKQNANLTVPDNVTNNWFNLSDLEDIIAFNYDLADDYGGNAAGVKVTDFQVYNDYENTKEKNPHKSYGYLRTPEFAGIVYNYLLEDRSGIYKLFNRYLNKMVSFFIWKNYFKNYKR